MSHVYLTKKNGDELIIHHDELKEAFPTGDGQATVCALKIPKRDSGEDYTFMVVNETTREIRVQLNSIKDRNERLITELAKARQCRENSSHPKAD